MMQELGGEGARRVGQRSIRVRGVDLSSSECRVERGQERSGVDVGQ